MAESEPAITDLDAERELLERCRLHWLHKLRALKEEEAALRAMLPPGHPEQVALQRPAGIAAAVESGEEQDESVVGEEQLEVCSDDDFSFNEKDEEESATLCSFLSAVQANGARQAQEYMEELCAQEDQEKEFARVEDLLLSTPVQSPVQRPVQSPVQQSPVQTPSSPSEFEAPEDTPEETLHTTPHTSAPLPTLPRSATEYAPRQARLLPSVRRARERECDTAAVPTPMPVARAFPVVQALPMLFPVVHALPMPISMLSFRQAAGRPLPVGQVVCALPRLPVVYVPRT